MGDPIPFEPVERASERAEYIYSNKYWFRVRKWYKVKEDREHIEELLRSCDEGAAAMRRIVANPKMFGEDAVIGMIGVVIKWMEDTSVDWRVLLYEARRAELKAEQAVHDWKP